MWDKDNLKKIIAYHFYASRQDMELSQEQMSEKLDISTRSYSDIERRKYLCSTPVFIRYLLNCGVDINELLDQISRLDDSECED